MYYNFEEIKQSCEKINCLIAKYSKKENFTPCLHSFFDLFKSTMGLYSKTKEEEKSYFENIKECLGLKEEKIKGGKTFFELLDSQKINKKDFIEIEDSILVLVDVFLELDETRKEFETAKTIQTIKSKLIGPIIDNNSSLLIEMGLAKNIEKAKASLNKGIAINHFLSLEK
ncbi:MAG TPA: hypothetical protein DEF61_01505 [Firmicutes bacterium]|nr:hypothetical protein [Bacillota bacterium]HBM69842.1 hypothetical protein [Bacillota bacterium]HBX24953.1 hypothetical protein [Bacillota bacterium]